LETKNKNKNKNKDNRMLLDQLYLYKSEILNIFLIYILSKQNAETISNKAFSCDENNYEKIKCQQGKSYFKIKYETIDGAQGEYSFFVNTTELGAFIFKNSDEEVLDIFSIGCDLFISSKVMAFGEISISN
jgi:hypothetical protein